MFPRSSNFEGIYVLGGGQQFFQDSVESSSWGHKFIFPRSSNFEGIYFLGGGQQFFSRLGEVFKSGTQIYIPSEFELRGNIFFGGWATTFLRGHKFIFPRSSNFERIFFIGAPRPSCCVAPPAPAPPTPPALLCKKSCHHEKMQGLP